MRNRQKILNDFLEKLYRIEKELNALDSFSYDISQLYNGDTFPEQTKLSADNLESLMTAATHETASTIGFYRDDIEKLVKFIEFREKYQEFSDNELIEILEHNLSMEQKRNFSKRFDTVGNMIERIEELKQNWNETFENKDYSKIKKRLQI